MTLPTGTISASDFNVELRRPWNQPLSADDFQLRGIIGKQYARIETSVAEYRGQYLYAPYGYVYYADVCQGTSRGRIIADGNGGTLFVVTEYNSTACGYNPPPVNNNPPRGTLLQEYCSGGSLIGIYANGSGGTYEEVRQYNSPSCPSFDNGGG
jgi:hypothetical protein